MRPAAPLPHRTHLQYKVWLDTPVGLTPPKATPAGPERGLVFPAGPNGEHEARADGTQPGRLALLTIRNQGPAPVPGADLTALLGLAFPGAQVLAAWLSDAPAARKEHSRPASPERARPAGDFQLRPKGACTLTVILSGPPPATSRHERRDGTLADGKVTARSSR